MKLKLSLLTIAVVSVAVLHSCKAKKMAEEEAITQMEIAEQELAQAADEPVQDPSGIANALLSAVRGDQSVLNSYAPDVAFARVLSPKETKGMSDETIQRDMLKGLNDRLSSNVENLRKDLREKRVDPLSIKMVGFKEEPSTDPPLVPRVLSVTLGNDEWEAKIPVTYVKHESRIYAFEILNSVNVFRKKED